MEKKIKLKIESNVEGHQELELPLNQAIEKIATETENDKWLYCDGKLCLKDALTEKDRLDLEITLSKAKDVTLINAIQGGK
jgi:hypothetical protein